ncbi:ATP phosphoribosyltransferase [Candidatus Peregrinibacteria bacterium]|nr:ATP phosphoribosyltransferase [Candidatus Peregrinibacteria bacterium]
MWRSANYQINLAERSLFPVIDDSEISLMLLRPQEIPRYMAEGKLDFGICGYDCLVECECEERIVEMAELVFSKQSRKPTIWVLAVSASSPIRCRSELSGKSIQTEFVTMTRRWLAKNSIEANVQFSWGATEVKAGRFCDAIVEATETGNSLRRNGLIILDEVLRSTPRFIANPEAYADPWKREKMEDIVFNLRGVLDAEGKSWISLNVTQEDLQKVVQILPALCSPTEARLNKEGWSSLTAVVDEAVIRAILPKLKRAGAADIVVSPISRVIR